MSVGPAAARLQYAVVGARLRVTRDGSSTEYDGPSVRLDALALVRTAGGWSVRDTGTDGGVFVDGCRVAQLPLHARRPVTPRLGAADGAELTLEVLGDVVDEPEAPAPRVAGVAGRGVLRLGRGPGNDVVLDDPVVSRQHASLELASPPILRDLGSYDGTFVNGERITAIPLRPGDQITIGGHGFAWDGVDFTGQGGLAVAGALGVRRLGLQRPPGACLARRTRCGAGPAARVQPRTLGPQPGVPGAARVGGALRCLAGRTPQPARLIASCILGP